MKNNKERIINIAAIIVAIIVLISYFLIPTLNEQFNNIFSNWIDNVAKLLRFSIDAKEVETEQISLTSMEAVAQYAIFYIAIMGILFSTCLLLFEISKKILSKIFISNAQEDTNYEDFF